MTRLYRKNEIVFALLWIAAYVVLSGLSNPLSEAVGVPKSATAAVLLVLSLGLFFWIRKNHLEIKYGLCPPRVPAKRFLYYLPLAVIASASLRGGAGPRRGAAATVCCLVSMGCVGFLEELIFRGLLFRALEKDGRKRAVLVSSLTFGLGHIVNLFNESGQGLAETLLQIVFAVLAGFVLALIFVHGGSLIPCILFHAVNNALSALGGPEAPDAGSRIILNLLLIVPVLGGYLAYLLKTFPIHEK